MNFRNFNSKYSLLLVVAVVLFLAFFPPVEVKDTVLTVNSRTVILTDRAEQHILYGDARGGGHLYGVGKPCKSEFPSAWDAREVIAVVTAQAANDNLDWRVEHNGYQVAENMHHGVKVRVVMDDDRSHIITAYPTNQQRNPCEVK